MRSAPSLIRCGAHRPSAAFVSKPRNGSQVSPSRPMCRGHRLSRAHSRRSRSGRPTVNTQVIIGPLLGHSSPFEILLRLMLLLLPVYQLNAVTLQAASGESEIFEGFAAEEVESNTKTVCIYCSIHSHERSQCVSALSTSSKHRLHLTVRQILRRNGNACNGIFSWQ